ncbi:MAG: hypothetical protein PHD25_00775 [Bacteroidales bacterium]|nr:hypothetical protein [Bacteroidales bacterium]
MTDKESKPNKQADRLNVDPETERISKIRDILFGNNMSEYEERFNSLEERMNNSFRSLNKELTTKGEALELYAKQEFQSLIGEMKKEHADRCSETEKLRKDVDDLLKQLHKNSEEQATTMREMRDVFLQQLKNTSKEFQDSLMEMKLELKKQLAEIQLAKMDRNTLAAMLTEMAYTLSNRKEENTRE